MKLRLTLRPIVVLLLTLSFAAVPGSGQDPTVSPAIGLPRFSTITSGPDQINLGNLNVHWEFPIFSKPGRGLPFRLVLTFDNSLWGKNSPSAPGFWRERLGPAPGWGIRTTADGPGGVLISTLQTGVCNSILGLERDTWASWQYFDSSNVEHDFVGAFSDWNPCAPSGSPTSTSSGPVMASDRSGYLLTPGVS